MKRGAWLFPCGGRGERERATSLHPLPPGKVVRAGCVLPLLASRQSGASELPPISPCLPCVRGGAERMRSGGVVGRVQEKAACNRQPAPIRHPQPLSQGLSALPAPLTQGSQALRGFPQREPSPRGVPLREPSPAGDEGQKTKRPRKGSALRGRIFFFFYCTVSLPPSTPTVSRVSGARSWPMI